MKKSLILSVLSLCLSGLNAQTRAINDFLYEHGCRSCEVMDFSVPGWVVRAGTHFIDKEDMEDIDIQSIARQIDKVRVVTFSPKKPIENAAINDLRQQLKQADFEELMVVRDGKDNVQIFVKEQKETIKNVFIFVSDGTDEVVLLSLKGRFKLEEIGKIYPKTVRETVNSDN